MLCIVRGPTSYSAVVQPYRKPIPGTCVCTLISHLVNLIARRRACQLSHVALPNEARSIVFMSTLGMYAVYCSWTYIVLCRCTTVQKTHARYSGTYVCTLVSNLVNEKAGPAFPMCNRVFCKNFFTRTGK